MSRTHSDPAPAAIAVVMNGWRTTRATNGEPASLTPLSRPADDGGIDWSLIGIVVGGTVVLLGAVIPLLMRTRRRSGRVHIAA